MPASAHARRMLLEHYFTHGENELLQKELARLLAEAKTMPEAPLVVGEFQVRLNRYDEAIKAYRDELGKPGPYHKELRERVVEALMLKGDIGQAKREVEQVLKQSPDSATARAMRGLMRPDSDIKGAIADLNAAVEGAPRNGFYRFMLALAQRKVGNLVEAEARLMQAIELLPRHPQPLLSLARLYMDGSKFAKADLAAGEILALRPNHVEALEIRVEARINLSLPGQAAPDLARLVALAPGRVPTVRLQARMAHAERKDTDALRLYQQLSKMEPGNMGTQREVVERLQSLGKHEEGRAVLAERVRANPGNLPLVLVLADWDLAHGDFAQAEAGYRAVSEKEPGNPHPWAGMGRIRYHTGQRKPAEEMLRKALQASPSNKIATLYLGLILTEQGRYREAIPVLDKGVALAPEDPNVINNLAYALAESGGDLDRALSLAQRAVSQVPRSLEAKDTLGWVYFKRRLLGNAIEVFRGNAEKDPGNPIWRYHLGLALWESGDKEGAKREFQLALKSGLPASDRAKMLQLLGKAGA
ncbi:MAG: tetratricopeptide repeat protein [Acidobacteriia bacterium]|nr:tetratricopeptide repeat protein [Terriglobia bacterium]